MSALWWFALCHGLLLAVAQRDYCYANVACDSDAQCLQSGPRGDRGVCCQGHCIEGHSTLARGATCTSNPCEGVCTGADECKNGKCSGPVVNMCACIDNSDCSNRYCVDDKCTGQLARGASCTLDGVCKEERCVNGTCYGDHSQFLDDPCYDDLECIFGSCLDGVCTLTPVGGSCQDSITCQNALYCSSQTKKCTAKKAVGDLCDTVDACVSTAFCYFNVTSLQFTTCQQKISLGAACEPLQQCVPGALCNAGSCIRTGSLGLGAKCDNAAACSGYAACSISAQSQDRTDLSCVLLRSVDVGGNCSTSSVCKQYARCDGTYHCTASALDKSCDFNTTTSDDSQCFPGLRCGCGNTCVVDPNYSSSDDDDSFSDDDGGACSNELDAAYAILDQAGPYPYNLSPANQRIAAEFYCCSACGVDVPPESINTATVGYQVNCEKMTITAAMICTPDQAGEPLIVGCKQRPNEGAATALTVNLSLLLLSSLFFSLALLFS